MKSKYIYILSICAALVLTDCTDNLDIKPLDKVSSEQLLRSEEGIKTLLANLYSRLPIEDFNYRPDAGFDGRGITYPTNTDFLTQDANQSGGSGTGGITDGYWPYNDIREVNLFFQNLEKMAGEKVLSEEKYLRLKSEAHFLRAYMYFGLAKRYGGVPLIDELLDDDYVPGSDNENLYIPRSTEKETWEFVLKEFDLAAENLPGTLTTEEGVYRATKWAAYGLKSRAALFAASVAKYSDQAPLVGEAVEKHLVEMSNGDAAFFYEQCISASQAIMDNSGKTLFKPNPQSPEEAAQNFQELFLTPITSNSEIIFSKAYIPASVVPEQGHMWDLSFSPIQVSTGWRKEGRYSPTLELVDLFTDYRDDGSNTSAEIITRTDGNERYTVANPRNLDVSLPFKKYSRLTEPFENKDARLFGSIIVPGATWKGVKIIMQGGLIKPDGSTLIYGDGSAQGLDGNAYYAYGGEGLTDYSGFKGLGKFEEANYSNSGFSVKKYLQEDEVGSTAGSSTQDFIDMRLAEIYLNYAEAVAESGQGDAALATTLLNAVRKRAGHTDEVPLTLENILKERRMELAFEGKHYWDLIRRRDFHILFNSYKRASLVPILDLRENPPKYIFVRANNYYDENAGGRTFQPYMYYASIPGRNTNQLIQNPHY